MRVLVNRFFFFFSTVVSSFSFGLTLGSINMEGFFDHDPFNTPNAVAALRATFNEEQMTDDVIEWFKNRENPEFECETSNYYDDKRYIDKSQSMIEMIIGIGAPDIVALQEAESAANTADIFATPAPSGQTLRDALKDLGYSHFLVGKQHYYKTLTTAFISKVPVEELESVQFLESKLASSLRDIQRIRLLDDNTIVYNIHAPSQTKTNKKRSEIRKTYFVSLSAALRGDFSRGEQSIVLGDFNLHHFDLGEYLPVKTGRSEVFGRVQKGVVLNDPWHSLPPEERWESLHSSAGLAFSNVLVSGPARPGEFWLPRLSGFERLDRFPFLQVDVRPYRWVRRKQRDVKKPYIHAGIGYSDHLPIRLELDKQTIEKKKKLKIENSRYARMKTPFPLFPDLASCSNESSFDLLNAVEQASDTIPWSSLHGQCAIISPSQGPLVVEWDSIGQYLVVGGKKIHLATTRNSVVVSNIDDSRVDMELAKKEYLNLLTVKTEKSKEKTKLTLAEKQRDRTPGCPMRFLLFSSSKVNFIKGRLQVYDAGNIVRLFFESAEAKNLRVQRDHGICQMGW